MKTYVLGDLHGNLKALKQCFERSKFDFENDKLIVLGDIVDGYPQSKECVEELMKIKNLVYIIGNHDFWMMEWMRTGAQPHIWTSQGGLATLTSYYYTVNESHRKFFNSGVYFYIDENRLFVHGGLNLYESFENQVNDELMWDRSLIEYAYNCHNTKSCDIPKKLQIFKEIYVGHTTTEMYNTLLPLHLCNVWMLDTGAGFDGKLTIMNIDTKEYWQSDLGSELYGANQGRETIKKVELMTDEEILNASKYFIF